MDLLRCYVAAVTALGAAAAAWVVLEHPDVTITVAVVALGLATVVAELRPVAIVRRDGNEEIEVSHAFVLAVLLIAGPAAAVLTQMASSTITNVATRRPLIKGLFNVGQKSGAAALAAMAFVALAPGHALSLGNGLTSGEIGAFIVAALVFQLINDTAVTIVCALAEHRPVLDFVREDLRPFAFNAAVSLTAPLAAVGALAGAWLVPIMVAPLWALHSAAKLNVEVFAQTRRDALTGLPNAVALREALEAIPEHQSVAIAMIDLDGFKEVNDTLGHRTGDLLLRAVAERLALETREQGRVFRLQGDEFVTVLDDATAEEALLHAEGLLHAFQVPFMAETLELDIGLSVGVALSGRGECDTDDLLRRADVAMYQAKSNRNGFALYNPGTDTGDRARQVISADLRRALEHGELEVNYQPQISLRTGRIESVEALVRWRRQDGVLVPPNDFIPQAERTGVILPLTLHVLSTALADCRRWTDEHGYSGRVGINLSARTLHHPRLIGDVRVALEAAGLPAERLEVEITESALMADPEGARRTLSALHELGIEILIDDFGTGYSSLAYLGNLPADGIKIDRSFVAGMADHKDAVIVQTTLDLGRNLGLRVVAEGVEDEATRDRLAALDCDLAQGWLWSPAVPASELAAALAHQAGTTLAA